MGVAVRSRKVPRYPDTSGRPYVALIVLALVLAGGLTVLGVSTMQDGWPNFEINLGAEMFTALITIAIIAPLVGRYQDRVVRHHPSLSFRLYVQQSASARRQIQVFSTFADLLATRDTNVFLANVRALLTQGGHADFLLLHPDSLTAEQRQQELRSAGVRVAERIIGNLHTLDAFRNSLSPELARNIDVRLYDASASIIMYRWDDKSLISFLAPDQLAEEGTSLEIDMRSPIGAFVGARFAEIWSQPRTITLSEYMAMPLRLDSTEQDDALGVPATDVAVRYVVLDGGHYVDSSPILLAQSRHPDVLMRARQGRTSPEYDLILVDPEESPIHTHLTDAFWLKYRDSVEVFMHLRPLAQNG